MLKSLRFFLDPSVLFLDRSVMKKLGLGQYIFPKKHNDNQNILKRTGMLVLLFAIEEGGVGWQRHICVSCFCGRLVDRLIHF